MYSTPAIAPAYIPKIRKIALSIRALKYFPLLESAINRKLK
jgi:hypothetical protein